jgi:folate-binding protein YgfZ
VSALAADYRAATEALAVFERGDRARLLVRGRAPGQMLKGILSGLMPPPPHELAGGVWAGRATYHAVLTPKGKMVTDLWASLLGDEESAGYLLDVPAAGTEPLLASLARLLPPRFAKLENVSGETDAVAAVGPKAADVLSRAALDGRVTAAELGALEEGEWRSAGDPTEGLLVTRNADVWPEAYVVEGPRQAVRSLRERLSADGATPAARETWTTLRVEAGRPEFGVDMDSDTIPPEAGIEGRAIDQGKGCYTGQEVIVRIRDRGHVNRSLRLLDLGDAPVPARGAELLAGDGSGKVVGRVTSAVRSPRHGATLALAYVARGAGRASLHGRMIDTADRRPAP